MVPDGVLHAVQLMPKNLFVGAAATAMEHDGGADQMMSDSPTPSRFFVLLLLDPGAGLQTPPRSADPTKTFDHAGTAVI